MGLIEKREIDKKPTKKTRTDEARPFSDEIIESLYPSEPRKADLDIEKMLLKTDNNKINNLSKKLKTGLPVNEYNEIIDDINKLDKKVNQKLNTEHL